MTITTIIFLWIVFIVIARMIMFKWMTPEQVEQHKRETAERNGKMLRGAGEGAKVLLNLWLSKRK